MRGYEFSVEARNDLQEIWAYIAQDNPTAADQLETDIYAACQMLAENPRLGHKRLDLTDEPVRFWLVRSVYLVVDFQEVEDIRIVRVLHGARDA